VDNGTTSRYKRVMIIDDSPIDRYIAEKMIKKNAFADDTIAMASAVQALDYLKGIKDQTQLPTLIFLDIRMPEMNGFEFLEEYKKLHDQVKENCIIVMITSSADTNDQRAAEGNAYVRGFVDKPLSREKLDQIAEHYDANKRLFRLTEE
jgi:CheY-like chemotaxis protein